MICPSRLAHIGSCTSQLAKAAFHVPSLSSISTKAFEWSARECKPIHSCRNRSTSRNGIVNAKLRDISVSKSSVCSSSSTSFSFVESRRSLSGRLVSCCASSSSKSSLSSSSPLPEISVDVLVREEIESQLPECEKSVSELERDCQRALALALERAKPSEEAKVVEVSVLITDDEEIKNLNSTWRGIDRPTDVLSFPNGEVPPGYDAVVLGDIIISAQTAKRQALERGHDIQREMRILLVHGLLHLLDYDHELSGRDEEVMKAEEERILEALNWTPKGGLITMSTEGSPSETRSREIKLVALDMDGTLLNSDVLVSQKNAEALMECERKGIRVILATGKARTSALLACEKSGLGHMFDSTSPGIFIQGLLVHGPGGKVLNQTYLPRDVVRKSFLYAEEANIATTAFLGDKNVTLKSHPRLDELHERYFEPASYVAESIDEILEQNVYKILFYGDDERIINESVKPYWEENIVEGAQMTRAIPEMLELVPKGTSKATGLQVLIQEYGVLPSEIMAVGDGENDVEMLGLAGIGVAVENATPNLKEVADCVVSSNNEDGVAEAIHKFVL